MTRPKRFFLVVFSDSGHLNPFLAIAQHLERAGHEVVVHSLGDDVGVRLARAGLRAACTRREDGPALSARPTEAQRSIKLGQRFANLAWLKRWNTAILVETVPRQIETLRPLLRSAKPDVVVVDAMAYSGAAAAELEGLPWASISTGLQGLVDEGENVYRDLAGKRDEVLASCGTTLTFRESEAISPKLHAVLATEDLVPPSLRAGLSLVGPALPMAPRGDEREFPFDRLPNDRPIVYVAFGSLISHPPEVYRAFVESMSASEAFFVLAVKDLVAEPFVAQLPPHVLAVDFAPQLALLERADVMVNHGGANSVHECLSHGRPMIVVPLVQEHRFFGRLVEAAGVGVTIAASDVTASRCREALARLVRRDAPERARAEALGKKAGNGAARVCELLARLADEPAVT